MSHVHRLNILRWIKNGEASYNAVIPAVERFGEATANRQANWIEAMIRKRFNEEHIALLKELPSEEAQKIYRTPHVTCASPLCPDFDKFIEAGSMIVAIEPKENLAMSYVPFKPIAGLDEVHDSPLDGNDNWRGRGEHNVLWLHLTCLEAHSTHHHDPLGSGSSEFPTLNQPLANESRLIQLDPRPFIAGTECIQLDSPSIQTVYKWQGVVQLEKALAFKDGNEGFYINDDMDAAYLVEDHSKFRGGVAGMRLEVTGAQARGQLLSVLLRYIHGRKTEALKKTAESTNTHGYVEFAMSVERRVKQIEDAAREEAENKAGGQRSAARNAPAQTTHNGREISETETGASDGTHIEGLEMLHWTLSRPDSSTAAENNNLGDGLIPRYDKTKWGTLSPEDATLIFWNRVSWRLGPPNGEIWVRFPARVVRMSAKTPDDASTLASDTTLEVGIWPMNEARSEAPTPFKPSTQLPLWEQKLAIYINASRTPPESEGDGSETSSSGDWPMDDAYEKDVDGTASEDECMTGEEEGVSSEDEGASQEVEMSGDESVASASGSTSSEAS